MPALLLFCCFSYSNVDKSSASFLSYSHSYRKNVFVFSPNTRVPCIVYPRCSPDHLHWSDWFALPKTVSAERTGKPCHSLCFGNTAHSALTQVGLTETIDSVFPYLPFSVLLGYLGQHRPLIRLFCQTVPEVAFYSMWVKISCVKTCQESI